MRMLQQFIFIKNLAPHSSFSTTFCIFQGTFPYSKTLHYSDPIRAFIIEPSASTEYGYLHKFSLVAYQLAFNHLLRGTGPTRILRVEQKIIDGVFVSDQDTLYVSTMSHLSCKFVSFGTIATTSELRGRVSRNRRH